MRRLMRLSDPSAMYPKYDDDLETEWGWQRDLKYPMPEPVPKTPEEIAEGKRILEEFMRSHTP